MKEFQIFNLRVIFFFNLVSFADGGKEKSVYTIDNLFNLINDATEDEYYVEDDDNENIIKEKTHTRNTRFQGP